MTLGELKAQIVNWMRERVDDALCTDAANDAIENLWMSIILVRLQLYLSGPVANISLSSGAERFQLVSIPDPVTGPTLSSVAVSGLPAIGFDVTYTLVTESGSETKESAVVNIVRAANKLIQVALPAGVYASASAGAVGWNVYAGPTGGVRSRQNDVPVDFALNFQEPLDVGFTNAPDDPLAPAANTTGDNIFFIEHIEVQLPDTTYKAWNAADLDSIMMRSAARSIASTSLYQNYMWDIVSGNQLEIRPPAGMTLLPRYFYVQKPRRLRFDKATLPFTTVPCALFLRCFAISLLKLGVEEYQASQMWDQKAGAERTLILQALNKQNANRNDRITPFMT
jgi:hypothetical protein